MCITLALRHKLALCNINHLNTTVAVAAIERHHKDDTVRPSKAHLYGVCWHTTCTEHAY